jgi:hypothetical protein
VPKKDTTNYNRLFEIFRLAWLHLSPGRSNQRLTTVMQSTAELCFSDALELASEGKTLDAANRACVCLKFTVGIGGADYRLALEIVKRLQGSKE